ncbi:MAG: mandelate racemase/muconate lactonizing enzyme family protein, partial [Alphaproteobacteria bacterium]
SQRYGTLAANPVSNYLSGIDIALWDLRGKLLGQPVWRLMGGAARPIRAYAGGMGLGWQPPESLVAEVTKYVGQGYTAIKLRIGDNPADDYARVAAVRRAFPDLDIAVDAATRIDRSQIRSLIRLAENNDVYWIEEPFAPHDHIGYAELRQATRIPVAGGENHFLRQAFRDLFEARAIAVAQADCTKAGGLTETKKIMDMAASYGVLAAPHTSQSVISTAANAHLLCTLSNALIYEADISAVNPWRDDLATPALAVENGCIIPTNAPGLGLDINEAMLTDYPVIPGPCYVPGWWPGQ